MSRPFESGETILLVDRKDRSKLVRIADGESHHTHTGILQFDDIIGKDEGAEVETAGGAKYMAMRPTMAEYVTKMKRGAQIIYPKDLGQILIMADIFPGARVLEAGVGSGSLSMTLLRAGAEVTGYELREDFASVAKRNVEAFLGAEALERYNVELRDIYEGIDGSDFDRIVLDLPEPWQVVEHAAKALRPGGILVSYLPSITQVSNLRDALNKLPFAATQTVEVLQRGWYVEGKAVRPDHRMVAHTAFLTQTRLLDS